MGTMEIVPREANIYWCVVHISIILAMWHVSERRFLALYNKHTEKESFITIYCLWWIYVGENSVLLDILPQNKQPTDMSK